MKKQLIFLIFLIGTLSFAVEVEDKKYEIKDKFTIINGDIPVFKSEGRLVSNKAVDIFELLVELVTMESRRFFVEDKKVSPNSFVLKTAYSKKENQIGIESYVVKTYYYIGGEHGMMIEHPYNFKEGKEVSLGGLFKEGVNYNTLIKNKIEEIIIEEDPSVYYDYISIKGEGYKFYFSEDNLVIIFNVYEIGPYESGILSFNIPISELIDYLK